MISIFRHHLQGRMLRYTIYFISFLVAFPMVLTIVMRWFDPESGQWAIKINGHSVGIAQYQERTYELEQQIERFKRMFGPNAERLLAMQGLLSDTHKLVINQIIVQKLYDEVAHTQTLHLSPTFIRQYFLQALPKELLTPAGTIDAQKLAQVHGMSIEHLEQQTYQQLQQQLLDSLTQGALYIPQFQIKQAYMAQYADRSFTVATFSHTDLLAHSKRAIPTQSDVQAFFESENKKSRRYWIPEQRSAMVWEFDADHYGVALNEEQIKKYYNRQKYQQFIDHPATVQVRTILLTANGTNNSDARGRLTELRQELIKNPTQFAQKAQELSHDAASKKNGGLLPAFARGTHDPVFEQAALALAKQGDISPVIQTKRGLEIIQLVSKNAQTYKPLDKVRDAIVKALRGERFGQFFGFEAKRALAQENKEQALIDFAQRKGGKKRVVQLSPADAQAGAYQQKIFVLGKGAGVPIVDGTKGYIVLVTDIIKTYKPTLQAVQERVMRDLHQYRVQQELSELLNVCQRQTSKQAFEQLVRAHGGQLANTGMIAMHNEKQTASLRKQMGTAFDQLIALAIPGGCVTHNADDRALIARLDQIAPFNEQQFNERKHELVTHMVAQQKRLLEQAFIASLFKNATIKVNEQLIK